MTGPTETCLKVPTIAVIGETGKKMSKYNGTCRLEWSQVFLKSVFFLSAQKRKRQLELYYNLDAQAADIARQIWINGGSGLVVDRVSSVQRGRGFNFCSHKTFFKQTYRSLNFKME